MRGRDINGILIAIVLPWIAAKYPLRATSQPTAIPYKQKAVKQLSAGPGSPGSQLPLDSILVGEKESG